ncbi:MAG: hypothetical protein IIZ74_08695 [Erysipelotrichaceae bacterium]|nr:hypothetical protein [Erysipelotrichaceae bacterium]
MSNSMKTIMIIILAAIALLSFFMTFRFRSLRQQAIISNDEQFQQSVTRKMRVYTIIMMLIFSSLFILTAYFFISYFSH